MKTHVLFLTLCCFVCSLFTAFASIRNGYTGIQGAIESLRSIERLLKEDSGLSLQQKLSMKEKRKDLIDYIAHHRLTEEMLKSFHLISPELYARIDTLTDRKHRQVHVYVRFVSEATLTPGVAGTTNIGHDENDPDMYVSEYGAGTVSVTIAAVKKSLHLLAHELGHVEYQVKNLAAYAAFYNSQYGERSLDGRSIGHNDQDLSGKSARLFVKTFQAKYLQFLRSGQAEPTSQLVLLQNIQNQVANGDDEQ